MKKWLMFVIAGYLIFGILYGEMELTPEQQAAVDSVNLQIFKTEQAQFNKTLPKANKGDPAALYQIGSHYISGYGVEKDPEKGYALVRQAAEKGYADAQNMIGDHCGETSENYDYSEALSWWRKAAAQGQCNAQYSIGQLYEQGMSVPQSDSLAVYWFRKAAEQGLIDALFAVSSAYNNGKGVAQDYQEALFWILLAFPESWDAGYDSIELVAYQLTATERTAVETRAKKWLAKHKK